MNQKRILILGCTWILGHILFRYLSQDAEYDVKAALKGWTA